MSRELETRLYVVEVSVAKGAPDDDNATDELHSMFAGGVDPDWLFSVNSAERLDPGASVQFPTASGLVVMRKKLFDSMRAASEPRAVDL